MSGNKLSTLYAFITGTFSCVVSLVLNRYKRMSFFTFRPFHLFFILIQPCSYWPKTILHVTHHGCDKLSADKPAVVNIRNSRNNSCPNDKTNKRVLFRIFHDAYNQKATEQRRKEDDHTNCKNIFRRKLFSTYQVEFIRQWMPTSCRAVMFFVHVRPCVKEDLSFCGVRQIFQQIKSTHFSFLAPSFENKFWYRSNGSSQLPPLNT